MRQIGNLPTEPQAKNFTDYLFASGITASAQEEDGNWCIWVTDEDQLAGARNSLAEFRENPTDPKFVAASSTAEQLRKQQASVKASKARQVVDVRREIWGQPTAKKFPLTVVLIGICVGVAIFSDFGKRAFDTPMRELSLCDGTHRKELGFDPSRDGLIDVKRGEVWRALTPIFIHYDLMHIAFNMLLFYPLAGQIEARRSTLLLGVLVLSIGVFSNVGQFFWSRSPWFGGMSGVVYGLLGYIWIRMARHPGEGLRVHQQTVVILVGWLVLGVTGALEYFGLHVANAAHVLGLVGGAAIAAALPAKKGKRKKPAS